MLAKAISESDFYYCSRDPSALDKTPCAKPVQLHLIGPWYGIRVLSVKLGWQNNPSHGSYLCHCYHNDYMIVFIFFPCQVLCIGPTGTGKTLSIVDKLSRNMPVEYIPDFITFSAKTSANQTQDLIDGKLDKRWVLIDWVAQTWNN